MIKLAAGFSRTICGPTHREVLFDIPRMRVIISVGGQCT